ncbi:MAG: hypothetical protein FWD64_06270 [Acidobacteriaceae bacterium]|nr:hypothetical protein [Acidobacteriaceae bacterium]
MKIRSKTTLISALLLTLCLATFIPSSLKFVSTWREPYFNKCGANVDNLLVQTYMHSSAEDFKQKLLACGPSVQNVLVPWGFFSLGFVMIGLITLWTGYRKNERRAWFVMFIIVLFYVFSGNVLPLLQIGQSLSDGIQWLDFFKMKSWEDLSVQRFGVSILTFLVMLIALLLPVKAFFWKPANSKVLDEQSS